MDWRDEAIILGARRHGERDVILDVLTRQTGRYKGYVRGGAGKTHRGTIQTGNTIDARWRSRVETNLGHFTVELVDERASHLFPSAARLSALTNATGLLIAVLPEREVCSHIYEALLAFLDLLILPELTDPEWGMALVKFEQGLLSNLGYGLDLECCAATGQTDDLIYVSPNTGRAVSGDAGAPYHDKMLVLPRFLKKGDMNISEITKEDIHNGLKLTGYFLDRHLLHVTENSFPEARYRLLNYFTDDV